MSDENAEQPARPAWQDNPHLRPSLPDRPRGRSHPLRRLLSGRRSSVLAGGVVIVVALAGLGAWLASRPPAGHDDPAAFAFESDDVIRFIGGLERTSADDQRCRGLASAYRDRGSAGVAAMDDAGLGDFRELCRAVRERRAWYASLGDNLLELQSSGGGVRVFASRLERLHPEAVYPDIYLVVGGMERSSAVHDGAILIAAEMFALDDAAPIETLDEAARKRLRTPAHIQHEALRQLLILNQPRLLRTSLLARALRAGTVDVVAEHVTGFHLSRAAHADAAPHERVLWEALDRSLRREDDGPFRDAARQAGLDPDEALAFMGYRIVRAYAARRGDDALATLFTTRDYPAVLQASGYSGP